MPKLSQTGGSSDAESLWERCLGIIRDNVSAQVFKTWFEQIRPLKWDGTLLTVEVPSQFFYEWIEEHYSSLLQKTIQKVMGAKARLQYQVVVDEGDSTLEQRTIRLPGARGAGQTKIAFPESGAPSPAKPAAPSAHYPTYFNPRYTFENFIRGENNQLATSAAMAVADNPGKTRYNPLVIYGPTGLGKTHLVQAIGNRVLQRDRNARVLYTNSEKFTMEYINAIQTNRVADFTNFYRSVDVLIVDDIQFLGGKEKTQDMFFHTFNALHQAGRQLILTSDKQPKDLADVDERLISRFTWGLTADIGMPDFETRMAILQQKSMEEGTDMPGDVLEYIARHVTSSVRELEGCLISLLAKVSLDGRELTLELAKEVVRGVTNSPSARSLTIDDIKNEVAAYYGQDVALLSAKTRKHEVVLARQMSMYLSKQLTKMSLKSIGMHFGGRDHTTVLHSCQQILNYIDTDKKVRADVEHLRKALLH
ncbi:MAG TPA: chromosomal replication initiator protein DnaA [Bacteroidetes bacterium]|nr:chromosomal replication initiator protein DnaA [Bacteroidota bacterium]HRK05599.1 chromosomal replication initiator protein DnaA [Chlorobiota bacterium]